MNVETLLITLASLVFVYLVVFKVRDAKKEYIPSIKCWYCGNEAKFYRYMYYHNKGPLYACTSWLCWLNCGELDSSGKRIGMD